jgi:hypothetical protein
METLAMIRQGVHGKSKLTKTAKGETDEEQSQDQAHHFL